MLLVICFSWICLEKELNFIYFLSAYITVYGERKHQVCQVCAHFDFVYVNQCILKYQIFLKKSTSILPLMMVQFWSGKGYRRWWEIKLKWSKGWNIRIQLKQKASSLWNCKDLIKRCLKRKPDDLFSSFPGFSK